MRTPDLYFAPPSLSGSRLQNTSPYFKALFVFFHGHVTYAWRNSWRRIYEAANNQCGLTWRSRGDLLSHYFAGLTASDITAGGSQEWRCAPGMAGHPGMAGFAGIARVPEMARRPGMAGVPRMARVRGLPKGSNEWLNGEAIPCRLRLCHCDSHLRMRCFHSTALGFVTTHFASGVKRSKRLACISRRAHNTSNIAADVFMQAMVREVEGSRPNRSPTGSS